MYIYVLLRKYKLHLLHILSVACYCITSTDSFTMAARPKLKEFSGEPTEDFALWFKRFELFVPAAAVDAAPEIPRRHVLLPLYLTGRAFLTYDSLPDETKGNYVNTKQALKERLDPPDHALVRRQEFMVLNRGLDESISAFELRVLTKASTAFEDFPEDHRNLLCKEQFMRGVGDSDLQLYLLTQNPATVRAAAQLAEQYYQVRKVTVQAGSEAAIRRVHDRQDERVSSPVQSHDEINALRDDVRKLSQQMERMMSQYQTRGRGRGRGRRGNRGQGHYNNTPAQQRPDSARDGTMDHRERNGSHDRRQQMGDYNFQHRVYHADGQQDSLQHRGYHADNPQDNAQHRGYHADGQGQFYNRFNGDCYNCGKYGHKSADCWHPPKPAEN